MQKAGFSHDSAHFSGDSSQVNDKKPKNHFGWSIDEDNEMRNCFQRHLLQGDPVMMVESEMALGLAKLLNWIFQRRTVAAIYWRIRKIQTRNRKVLYIPKTCHAIYSDFSRL